jgi:Uma2 family endonuclease
MSVDMVRRRFTVNEYLQMAQAGILSRRPRVELLDGEIVEMTPGNAPHGSSISNLNRLLINGVGPRAVIWPQSTILLSSVSAPEPDLTVLRPRSYREALPMSEDVLLVVEVSDSSLRRDRELKLPLYARGRIPEYWIVDVNAEVIEVHTGLSGSRYASARRFGKGEFVSPTAFPDLRIPVDEIFA